MEQLKGKQAEIETKARAEQTSRDGHATSFNKNPRRSPKNFDITLTFALSTISFSHRDCLFRVN